MAPKSASSAQQRTTSPAKSSGYSRLSRGVCEWRLGRARATAQPAWPGQDPDLDAEPVTVPEIQKCLKRIRESIRFWNKEGGEQAYLRFIGQFLP